MGDMSAEPSMEDILSSIKRIIAEEGDERVAPRPRRAAPVRPVSPAPAIAHDDEDDEGEPREVLELSDPMPPAPPRTAPESLRATPEPPRANPIVSAETAQATRGALDALSRLLVKPEASGDGTLEGLVREMLRPMLREWLDSNLPELVETIVAREIAKITGTR